MLKQACLVLLLSREIVNLSENVEDNLSKRVFKSLVKVLDYIYENRHYMNVDGLFGMIFVKVNLEKLNGEFEFLDTNILSSEMDKVTEILKASNYLQIDVKHKIFLEHVLDSNRWQRNITFSLGNFDKDYKMLSQKLNINTCSQYKKYMESDYFSEEISDQCVLQLVKSSISAPHHCHIDQLCKDYMIGDNNSVPGYGNTHRLLFLQIAEARKCDWNKKWLKKKIKEYCLHSYWEAQKNSQCGFIPELDDLLLEQILLCGFEGFIEFLPIKWIEYVLSIQTKHGCFGVFTPPSSSYNKDELRRRRKRESNVIAFGCLDHTTGLGAGVLSLFLRFLGDANGKLEHF